MSIALLTLLRFVFLAALWLFVIALAVIVYRDVAGTHIRPRNFSRSASSRASSMRTSSPQPARDEKRPEPSRPHGTLIVTGGPLAGSTLPLSSSSLVIGRSPDCALVLNDSYTSSRHARLFFRDNSWWLEDLDSTNGTFIGQEKIHSPQPLLPGKKVTIGRTTMEVRL